MDDSDQIRSPAARGGPAESRTTRRRFLRGAAGVAAAGAAGLAVDRLGGGKGTRTSPPVPLALPGGAHGATLTFRSRPDLKPPAVSASGRGASVPSLLLGPGSTADTSQQGPMIVDGE